VTDQSFYVPDESFNKIRLVVAMNLLTNILKDENNHTDAMALAPFMARVDEIICLEHQFFPESIKDQEPPAGYFDMDESAFEVPAA